MTTDALSTLARAFEAAAAVLRGTGVVPADIAVAVGNGSSTLFPVDAAPDAAAPATPKPPTKRGRGRPVQGEETAPTQPVEPVVTPVVAEPDPFSVESTQSEAPAATLQDVRAALAVVQAEQNQAAALELFKKASGVETLAKLTSDKYGAVFAAAIPGGKFSFANLRAVLVAAENRVKGGGTNALEKAGGVKALKDLAEDKYAAVILAAYEAK